MLNPTTGSRRLRASRRRDACEIGSGQQRQHGLADPALAHAQASEHLHRNPFGITSEREQQMLGGDHPVTETQRFAQRELQHPLRARGERHLTLDSQLARPDDPDHPLAHELAADAKRGQNPERKRVRISEQAKQLVLGPDVPMPEIPGRELRVDHDLAGLLGEPLEPTSRIAAVADHRKPAMKAGVVPAPEHDSTPSTEHPSRFCPLPGNRWVAFTRVSPTECRTASRSYVSLPLARGLGSASGPDRRFGLRQPPDPHKGGNQR
jgi:hypothetical protein